MKRLSPPEMALLCAPLLLLVAVPIYTTTQQLLNPSPTPHNPSAKIVLTVARIKSPLGQSNGSRLAFGWTAKARNSPQGTIVIKFAESIIATGHEQSLVIYQAPAGSNGAISAHSNFYVRDVSDDSPTLQSPSKTTDFLVRTDDNGRYGEPNRSEFVHLSWQLLPSWADKLEWRGEVVAVPTVTGNSAPTSTATLRKLAQISGATRIVIRFPIDISKRPSFPLASK